jgi:hypothetical protein
MYMYTAAVRCAQREVHQVINSLSTSSKVFLSSEVIDQYHFLQVPVRVRVGVVVGQRYRLNTAAPLCGDWDGDIGEYVTFPLLKIGHIVPQGDGLGGAFLTMDLYVCVCERACAWCVYVFNIECFKCFICV